MHTTPALYDDCAYTLVSQQEIAAICDRLAAEITEAIINHLLGKSLETLVCGVRHGQRHRSLPEGRRLLTHLIIPGIQPLQIQLRQIFDDIVAHGL